MSTTITSAPAATTSRVPLSSRLLGAFDERFHSIPVLIVLAVIWGFFTTQSSAFLSSSNLTNLVLQIATTAILALGIVFVLLVGEIDLSSAVLSGVTATIVANLVVRHDWSLWPALAVGVLCGMVLMGIQSAVVVFGVPSLIVTLGGMAVFQGLLLVVLPEEFTISVGGTPFASVASYRVPAEVGFAIAAAAWAGYAFVKLRRLRSAGSDTSPRGAVVSIVVVAVVVTGLLVVLSQQGGLPLPAVILAAMLLVGAYVTTQTRYGVHLYAVGGNRQAAQRSGIPVRRMVMYSFLILGACAAIAGVVDAARLLGVSNSSGGGSLMLNAIAAAVVGGASLFGGRGTVWSALLGALVIGSINNGVQLLGYSTEVQNFATGGVLIAAVAMDVVLTRGSLWPRRP